MKIARGNDHHNDVNCGEFEISASEKKIRHLNTADSNWCIRLNINYGIFLECKRRSAN